MRPQQQNRRMRGRGNNANNSNRKGPNPLTRNYESNGPDVKIRGSAHQIAEKYTTLARDAQSAGDRVMAENYLQHAEHYNRIIAAAQAQMPQQQMRDDQDGDDERDDVETAAEQNAPRGGDGSGPQPVIEGLPAEVAFSEKSGETGQGGEREQVNGAHANGPAGDDALPRRARRPRRSARSRDDQDGEATTGEPVGEAPLESSTQS